MKKEILPNVCESTQCKSCNKNCIWKPHTNADKIRAMTDEELAWMIGSLADCNFCNSFHGKEFCLKSDVACSERWENWLKQETER